MDSANVSRPGDKPLAAKIGLEAESHTGDALRREVSLLLGGGAQGIKDAAVDAWQHKGETVSKFGLSTLIGGGLAIAQGRAGMLRMGAEVAGLALSASFGLDVAARAGTIKDAVADTWRSGENLAENKAAVSGALGSFVVDSAIMGLGGAAGVKIGRMPSVYMNVHSGLDALAGNKMQSQYAALRTQMLDYHPGTAYHQDRVGSISMMIAKEMKLPPAMVETSYYSGLQHDVGKLKTPLEILNFTGSVLDPAQRAVINRHATDTGVTLRGQVDFPKRLADVPYVAEMHHERLDGKGTPNAVSADKIRMETRVNSVADVLDAMTHQRSYQDPIMVTKVRNVLLGGRGTQFDAAPVDALMRIRADKVLHFMLSEGDHVPIKGILDQFGKVSFGELLDAVANDYPISSGGVTRNMITTFNNFYGPDHLSLSPIPVSAQKHRLGISHL